MCMQLHHGKLEPACLKATYQSNSFTATLYVQVAHDYLVVNMQAGAEAQENLLRREDRISVHSCGEFQVLYPKSLRAASYDCDLDPAAGPQ